MFTLHELNRELFHTQMFGKRVDSQRLTYTIPDHGDVVLVKDILTAFTMAYEEHYLDKMTFDTAVLVMVGYRDFVNSALPSGTRFLYNGTTLSWSAFVRTCLDLKDQNWDITFPTQPNIVRNLFHDYSPDISSDFESEVLSLYGWDRDSLIRLSQDINDSPLSYDSIQS
jgi:hypothetical protein